MVISENKFQLSQFWLNVRFFNKSGGSETFNYHVMNAIAFLGDAFANQKKNVNCNPYIVKERFRGFEAIDVEGVKWYEISRMKNLKIKGEIKRLRLN